MGRCERAGNAGQCCVTIAIDDGEAAAFGFFDVKIVDGRSEQRVITTVAGKGQSLVKGESGCWAVSLPSDAGVPLGAGVDVLLAHPGAPPRCRRG